ncbi:hypothetical protein [Agarilytica rhodophyticola]|nr:hypothetical protein [Agarilytica rhodophyticola]
MKYKIFIYENYFKTKEKLSKPGEAEKNKADDQAILSEFYRVFFSVMRNK